MRRFEGKTAVITGSSSGVGEACARKFVAEGARVVLAARSAEALDRLAADLGADHALAVPTDVSDGAACERLVQEAKAHFGRVDIVVNNAGFNSRGALQEIPVDDMMRILDVNLRGPMLLTRLILPTMLEQGSGSIIGVSSLAGRVPLDDEATYSAAKFGLRVFSFALAEELRGTDVRVSVVTPGPIIDTDFIMAEDVIESVPNLVFSQSPSTADEVAALVLECAADGKRERTKPAMGARLATLAYLFPAVRRVMKPRLEAKGARRKAKYMARHSK